MCVLQCLEMWVFGLRCLLFFTSFTAVQFSVCQHQVCANILHRNDCFVSGVKFYDAKESISHNIFNILYISARNRIQKKKKLRKKRH